MEYLFDSENVQKLLKNFELLYESFQKMSFLEPGTDEFYCELANLKRLTDEEDIIMQSFPRVQRILDNISFYMKKLYSNDNDMRYLISKRLDSIINSLCSELDEEDLDVKMEDYVMRESYLIQIHDNLLTKYIKNLFDKHSKKTHLKNVYSTVFSSKGLTDVFISNNFDINSFEIIKDEEMADKFGMSYEDYMYIKNEYVFDYAESILTKILTGLSFNDYISFNEDLILFETIIYELNDVDFETFRKKVYKDLKKISNNENLTQIKEAFDRDYSRRFSSNNEDKDEVLDDNIVQSLISLLKVEEVLYDKFSLLNLDNVSNDFNMVEALILYESEFVQNIISSSIDVSILEDIIFRDLGFFTSSKSDDRKKKIIFQRIKNLIADFHYNDLASGIVVKNYESIIFNHIVDSLNEFHKISDSDEFNRIDIMSVYKDIIFMYPVLTSDLIFLNGNYKMLSRLSDDVSAELLGHSFNSYIYDKNEQLYKLSFSLLEEIADLSLSCQDDKSLLPMLEFKLIEFNDIISSVNAEYYYEIMGNVSEIENQKVRKKIYNSIRKDKVYRLN